MKNSKQFWITASLINLAIVALLGVTLRSKILFPIESLDFKFVLHAHSHYAFGGWVTLALLSLMVYEVLPAEYHKKKIYQLLLWGILINAVGMLISFLCEGYAFFSILFSTLFIFVTYAFTWVFIKDALKAGIEKSVMTLSMTALSCACLSSIGPFTLAYLVASHSTNNLLYRDSIYTYLHFQYNGFFALGVFALFFNSLYKYFSPADLRITRKFANIASISVYPSLFISYLWHYPSMLIRITAVTGCVFVVATAIFFMATLSRIKKHTDEVPLFIYNIGVLSFIAFFLKSLLQTGTVIPALGKLVFGDRAIIIGYIHLVLLGFISLYLVAQMFYSGLLNETDTLTRRAVTVFIAGIIVNETVLMVQGFGNMLMVSNSLYAWLLWIAAIVLLTGATMIVIARLRYTKQIKANGIYKHKAFQSIVN